MHGSSARRLWAAQGRRAALGGVRQHSMWLASLCGVAHGARSRRCVGGSQDGMCAGVWRSQRSERAFVGRGCAARMYVACGMRRLVDMRAAG